jgi:oligopeptidase B
MSILEKSSTLKPPQAIKKTHVTNIHGQELQDHYFWLREKSNPEVMAHLEAENAYTENLMAGTSDFQERLYNEMLGRIKETDMSVPEKLGNYYYYSRSEEGKQYPILCRKQETLEAEEEILLDENLLAEGLSYFRVGVVALSTNHQFMAYSTDTDGSETYTLHIKDLSNNALLEEKIENVGEAVWAADNQTLFYTILDETKRPYKVFKHTLGQTNKTDQEIFEEKNQGFYTGIYKTRSRDYVVIHTASKITTEVWVLDAAKPDTSFSLVQQRMEGVEYEVEHFKDQFLILTNHDAVNFKIMSAPVSDPGFNNWQEFIPHDPDVKLDDIHAFKDHVIICDRFTGLQRLRVIDMNHNTEHFIDFPEAVYSVWSARNPEFKTTTFRFHYSSLCTPETIFEYDLNSKTKVELKQTEVLGGYDPNQYESRRLMAPSHDGTLVPLSIVYKKGMVKNTQNPVFLYGYGSYGINMDPTFRSTRLSLIDRGFIFAIAHIRGGEELGRLWYENGKFLKKKNTFEDFIACARFLISEGYTSEKQIAISGGSAGGLLMGAVLNMAPELFKACIASVAFVDALNTMLDETLPLTITEYEEWGNPNEPEYFEYMKSYSPYENVKSQAYPPILAMAGLNDPRVSYWEPAKWVARLRELKTDSNPVMLKTNMGAGHSGASGRYDYLKEMAMEFSFILDIFGRTEQIIENPEN